MKKFEDFEGQNLYFIGIGGISMSGLCYLSQHFGAKVIGSDTGNNSEIDKLKDNGVIVHNKHSAENITSNIDMVIYTSAISQNNEEYLRAIELGIKTLERSEFLGLISSLYSNVIAVSGTHGKTTTTAMIGEICVSAGLYPTIHLGGESMGLGGNTIIGGEKYFIVEACEYKESFRYLKPTIGVITNIEFDHLDYYKSLSSIETAFQKFANNSSEIVVSNDCHISHENVSIAFQDWEIKNLEFVAGGYNYNVFKKGVFYETFRLNMLGYHNVVNSLFAIIVADRLGISRNVIISTISSFMGVERRYETIHKFSSGCRVIIDYAHHYTEIENSIKGISDIYKNILVIFQPHTYSRTLGLFNEFVNTLSKMDNIVLFKTYPAREEYISGGSAQDLFDALGSINKEYFEDVNTLMDYLKSNANSYDCMLVLGAGDLAEILKRNYRNCINYC